MLTNNARIFWDNLRVKVQVWVERERAKAKARIQDRLRQTFLKRRENYFSFTPAKIIQSEANIAKWSAAKRVE